MNTTKETTKIRDVNYRSNCYLRIEFEVKLNGKRFSDESIVITDYRDYTSQKIEEILNSFLIDFEYGIRASVELGRVKYVYVVAARCYSTKYVVRLYNPIDATWLEVEVSKDLFTSKDVVRKMLPPYYPEFNIIDITDPDEKYSSESNDGNF